MTHKSTAQIDLDKGIVGTAADAERVAEAVNLFPVVLLREDARACRLRIVPGASAQHSTNGTARRPIRRCSSPD
jgi:hypothetical protein